MIELTKEHIDMIETPKGGFKRSSLAALGVSWPPKKGWRLRLEGTTVDEEMLALAIHFSETGKKSKAAAKEELSMATEDQRKLFNEA